MQRQSLGSPGPKPLVSAVAGGAEREEKRKSIGSAVVGATEADKGIRARPRAERLIHLIPVLTILCLLVLYLFSHDLSLPDSQTLDGAEMRLDSKGTMPADLKNPSFFSFLVSLLAISFGRLFVGSQWGFRGPRMAAWRWRSSRSVGG
nr:PREDICTED: uncharacterized protein LOC103971746 isoform X1 [Musa acuminata subsp. malaccensis]